MLKTKFCFSGERCFSSCYARGKKKFLVPIRIRTLDLRISRSDALPASEVMHTAGSEENVKKVFDEV